MDKRISVCIVLIIFVINVKTQRYNQPGSSLNLGKVNQGDLEDEVPTYNSLLQKLNILIPEVKSKNKEPHQIRLLHNLLNMIKFLALKLLKASQFKKNDPKTPQYIVLRSTVDEALQLIAQKGTVDPKILNRIANQLAQLFQEETRIKNDELAPYCEPGTDCFMDVDHAGIYGRVKNLANKVSTYIKYRNKELQAYRGKHMEVHPEVQVQIKADDILAHTTILLEKIHRSVMRNWHHILMIVGNLAGNDGGAIRLLGDPIIKKPVGAVNSARIGSASLNSDDYVDSGEGNFQCKIFIKGSPKIKPDSMACSSNIRPWFKNTDCVSPIKNSNRDCSPSFSGGRFTRLQGGNIGFQSNKRGVWNYHLTIQLNPGEEFNVTTDLAIGRVDKIISNNNLPKSLLHINNKIQFGATSHAASTVSKLIHEGSVFLEKKDIILLRIARVRSDLTLTFSAEFIGSKEGASSNNQNIRNSRRESSNQRYNTNSQNINYSNNIVQNKGKELKRPNGNKNHGQQGFTNEDDLDYEVDTK